MHAPIPCFEEIDIILEVLPVHLCLVNHVVELRWALQYEGQCLNSDWLTQRSIRAKLSMLIRGSPVAATRNSFYRLLLAKNDGTNGITENTDLTPFSGRRDRTETESSYYFQFLWAFAYYHFSDEVTWHFYNIPTDRLDYGLILLSWNWCLDQLARS